MRSRRGRERSARRALARARGGTPRGGLREPWGRGRERTLLLEPEVHGDGDELAAIFLDGLVLNPRHRTADERRQDEEREEKRAPRHRRERGSAERAARETCDEDTSWLGVSSRLGIHRASFYRDCLLIQFKSSLKSPGGEIYTPASDDRASRPSRTPSSPYFASRATRHRAARRAPGLVRALSSSALTSRRSTTRVRLVASSGPVLRAVVARVVVEEERLKRGTSRWRISRPRRRRSTR